MKKKLLLLVAMIIISITAISFAGNLQNKITKQQNDKIIVENNETTNKPVENSKTSETKTENKDTKTQNTEVKKENSQTSKTNSQENNTNKTKEKQTNTTQKETTKPAVNTINKDKEQEKKPNVIIVNAITNQVIYKGYVDIASKTAADVTIKALIDNKISYRAKGTGSSIYFSSIAGLKERDNGPNSGWCYFVNGKKPSVGAGGYTLKDGDILEWKYLEDGLN